MIFFYQIKHKKTFEKYIFCMLGAYNWQALWSLCWPVCASVEKKYYERITEYFPCELFCHLSTATATATATAKAAATVSLTLTLSCCTADREATVYGVSKSETGRAEIGIEIGKGERSRVSAWKASFHFMCVTKRGAHTHTHTLNTHTH